MKNFRWDKKYLYWGITAFLVIACSILFYILLLHSEGIKTAVSKLFKILSPIIWGLVIAYLINPVMKWVERVVMVPLAKKLHIKKESSRWAFARSTSIVIAVLLALLIVGSLLYLVLPQVYSSIESIVLNSPTYVSKGIQWVEKQLANEPELEEAIVSSIGSLSSFLTDWFKNTVLPRISDIVTNITTGIYSVVRALFNILIGLIASFYILYSKERFGAQIKKILYSLFSMERVEQLMKGINFADNAFIGFLVGKIIDSLIIGVICYVVCAILRIPYAVLVSVIVGVTNIIPFFGPFIGAIPSALIILMEDPLKCVIFVVFVFILQQFDGNVLGPKILGNTTGVSSFWIMFSIIVGGGLFGFIGMVIGVPLFAVIYAAIKRLVDSALEKRGLPKETAQYLGVNYIDTETGEKVMQSGLRRELVRHKKAKDAKALTSSEKASAAPAQDDEQT